MKRDFFAYRSTFQCHCIVHTAIVRQIFPDWQWPDEEPKFGIERRGKFAKAKESPPALHKTLPLSTYTHTETSPE